MIRDRKEPWKSSSKSQRISSLQCCDTSNKSTGYKSDDLCFPSNTTLED